MHIAKVTILWEVKSKANSEKWLWMHMTDIETSRQIYVDYMEISEMRPFTVDSAF